MRYTGEHIRERPKALRIVVGLGSVREPDWNAKFSRNTVGEDSMFSGLTARTLGLVRWRNRVNHHLLNDFIDAQLTNRRRLIQEAVRCTKWTVRSPPRSHFGMDVPMRQLWLNHDKDIVRQCSI